MLRSLAPALGLAWLVASCTPTTSCERASDCPTPLTCAARRCVAACLTDLDCATAESCIGGVCTLESEHDAGTLDAASCSDADGDGSCDEVDCDDVRADVHPGAIELCTASDGSALVDEDCDGTFDESCAFYFGPPHAVVDVQRSDGNTYWPRLSPDGLDLCFADGRPRCAHRATVDDRFGAPLEIASLMPEEPVTAVEMTRDRLEAIVESTVGATSGLWSARRETPTGAFGEAVPFAPSTFHPALSPDGLTLVAQRRSGEGPRLVISRRADLGSPFVDFDALPVSAGPDADGAPFVLDDGTIWFTRSPDGVAIQSFATDLDGSTTRALPTLDPIGTHLSYSQTTGELFFVSNGAWSTGSFTIFRARVCRDGPCPMSAAPCPVGLSSTLSPDRVHCYWHDPNDRPWSSPDCGAGHLATLHSHAEEALLFAVSPSESWIGLHRVNGDFVWSTGEPVVYRHWAASQPNIPIGTPGVSASIDGWNDRPNADEAPSFCEMDAWPTW